MQMPQIPSNEIADFLDLDHGGEVVAVSDVGSIESAGANSLTFCVYEDDSYIKESNAGVIICPPRIGDVSQKTLLYSPQPRLDFVLAVNEFFMEWPDQTEIHSTAVISEDAKVGDQCIIGPNVYIGPHVRIGNRCKIQAGTSIGGEGFGFFPDDDGILHKQIHKGMVIIDDNVEIGSNCSIDRAVFDETVIGSGTKMDNLIHIAHNTKIGENVWIADMVGIQGSVNVENRVRIHPNASIADHTNVGEDAEIAMNAAVIDDVAAQDTVAGVPAKSIQ